MDAIRFEKQLKRWSHAKKEALVAGDFETLKKLAECRNETNSKNYNPGSGFGYAQPDPGEPD